MKSFLPQVLSLVVCAFFGAIAAQAQTHYEPYPFSTLAGLAGTAGSTDDTGTAARFNSPKGIATDSAGNVYVGDTSNNTIRKITPGGVVATLAGCPPSICGAASQGSNDGTGSGAHFRLPSGVAVDATGNIYVADTNNHTIRKITPAGLVTTLAGLAQMSGSVDATGSNARFNFPNGVAVSSNGNLYVADTSNNTIRKITPTGVVTTVAGCPPSTCADSVGSDDATGVEARFDSPAGIAVDAAGYIYVADRGNSTVRKVTPAAAVTTLSGQARMTGSVDGGLNIDGTPIARFNIPSGVAVDNAGNVYVADSENSTIRKITPAFRIVRTLAGVPGSQGPDDGTGNAARFRVPFGVAVDSDGKVYVADTFNHTIRVGGPAPITPTQTIEPDPSPSPHPPEIIGPNNGGNNQPVTAQSATFTNLPPYTSLSVSFDISHPAPGEFLKVTMAPSRLKDNTMRPVSGPVFVLFDRERLVNAAGQPVTLFHSVVALPQSVNGEPFLGSDTYTVQVLNDTYVGATNNIGMFNHCSLTINPVNPGHAGPPAISLTSAREDHPLPPTVNINYGDSLVLLASAVANPSSSYRIDRLGIIIGPSPTPVPSPCLPEPSPSPQPIYRSDVVFQETPSSSGAAVRFFPPPLAPGDYYIASTALDNAGFAATSSANLKVNRLFGIFGVEVTFRHPNCELSGCFEAGDYRTCTVDFRARLTVGNMTENTSGNLRIRLISTPSAVFCDNDGPPPIPSSVALAPVYSVNPLPAGGSTSVNVKGQVMAPEDLGPGPHPLASCVRFINFDIFAILEELVQGEWISVDSAKVTEGFHRVLLFFNSGPGGGVNSPPPNLGGSPFDPYVLTSVAVGGANSVVHSASPHYTATATFRNSQGSRSFNVTTNVQWSVTPSPPFYMSPNGVNGGILQPSSITSNRTATIKATYTIGVTRSGTKSVSVTLH